MGGKEIKIMCETDDSSIYNYSTVYQHDILISKAACTQTGAPLKVIEEVGH